MRKAIEYTVRVSFTQVGYDRSRLQTLCTGIGRAESWRDNQTGKSLMSERNGHVELQAVDSNAAGLVSFQAIDTDIGGA